MGCVQRASGRSRLRPPDGRATFASRPAAASCVPAEPVAASLAKAEVVFVGTVVSTANRDRVAQVRVEEVWKGPGLPAQVEVRGTPFSAQDNAVTSVDRSFRTGVRYLFVPRGGSASPTSGVPVFEDDLCTATQEYHPNLDGLRPTSDPAGREGCTGTHRRAVTALLDRSFRSPSASWRLSS